MAYAQFFKGKRVAIPGGGGFFGSHIVEKLKVVGANIFVPRRKDGVDFRDLENTRAYFKEVKPEIVINCAADQGGIAYHSGRQADLLMDNIRMGLFLMQAAQESGVQKFVNIVSGCSYPGYLNIEELAEGDYWSGKLHDSIFSYGFARKASVVYGEALEKQFGFRSIHLLMANMFGPGEHFNPDQSKALAALMRKFYEAKRDGLPSVTVWGTGRPTRDWLYVKDGAEGILRASAVYNDVEPLNIATGVPISVTELAETVKRVVGYDGKIVYDTSRPDGALKKVFGVERMQKALDWLPETSLEDGIRETIAWLDANYDTATSGA